MPALSRGSRSQDPFQRGFHLRGPTDAEKLTCNSHPQVMREGTRVPEYPIYMEQAMHYHESISPSRAG
jgi:hypothetical protein